MNLNIRKFISNIKYNILFKSIFYSEPQYKKNTIRLFLNRTRTLQVMDATKHIQQKIFTFQYPSRISNHVGSKKNVM